MNNPDQKVALITGVSGQDGCYLADLLLAKGYEVHGTSRNPEGDHFGSFDLLRLRKRVRLHRMSLLDKDEIHSVLSDANPSEVYVLSGQSSVSLSFQEPQETYECNVTGLANVIEQVSALNPHCRIYQACSSECFGDCVLGPANEETPFAPVSPYGEAKAAAYDVASRWRLENGLFICSGILFNHESPLRPNNFVTRKIVRAAVRIAGGAKDKLYLGNTSIIRDWGWAPEYVEAAWRMLQQDAPEDLVICTGRSHTLEDFVAAVFDEVGLDWAEHVETKDEFLRPREIQISRGDSSRARKKLGWSPQYSMADVAAMLVAHERASCDEGQN